MNRSEIKILLSTVKSAENPLRDLFACGCVLYFLGHHRAGQKACNVVLREIGIEEPIFTKIMKLLPGNESEMAHAVAPNGEFLTPFRS